jgi:hypothetical protein
MPLSSPQSHTVWTSPKNWNSFNLYEYTKIQLVPHREHYKYQSVLFREIIGIDCGNRTQRIGLITLCTKCRRLNVIDRGCIYKVSGFCRGVVEVVAFQGCYKT